MLLLEIQGPNQRFIWHVTEADKLQSILKKGLVPVLHGIRGVAEYQTPSLFFVDSTDEETMEEIESMVRFGGVDFDDDEAMNQRNDVPLVLLTIDLEIVKRHDQENKIKRVWRHEKLNAWGQALEWITNAPIPPEAIAEHKSI